VLPTFFYFTVFTLIIVLWAVATLRKFSANVREFNKRVNQFILGINIGFYLIFIILVLVFQLSSSVDSIACKGRVSVNITDNTVKTQKAVSIVYAALISLISLVMGIGFLYFGPRMFGGVDNKNATRRSHKKLHIITGVASTGFILHCIFTLVVAGISQANMIFSFIGLVITEIAPSVVIILIFWKLDKSLDQSSGQSKSHGDKTHEISMSPVHSQ